MRSTRIGLRLAAVASLAVFAFACADGPTDAPPADGPDFAKGGKSGTEQSDIAAQLTELAAVANARTEEEGLSVRTERAFYFTASHEAGQTVFFNDRTKQLPIHFVPGDPRRVGGNNMDIAYMVDQVKGSNLPIPVTTAAIDRAMATWDGVECSTIPITRLPDIGPHLGLVVGGFPAWLLGSDITHAGWLGLPPGVLGVSFPFGFIDGSGNFTDINNDGKLDVAFWEIYYNVNFAWADDGVSNIDVETVALHEAGHGLDQGHFGKLFRTDSNGKFHFAPRAVMNAGYTGPQRTISATDNGGHCSIWGSWPNK
jgi:hypothetical protein